jgi:hypothetical protein
MSNKITKEFLREYLIAHDEKYRELDNEHRKYEARLGELAGLSYPNEEERIEAAILKKKKLLLKDQLEAIVALYPIVYDESKYGKTKNESTIPISLGQANLKEEAEPTIDKGESERCDAQQEGFSAPCQTVAEEEEQVCAETIGDLDVRLVPPPMPQQKIRVKLKFIGDSTPRISFDPEKDWTM